jgi:hypothetical protein
MQKLLCNDLHAFERSLRILCCQQQEITGTGLKGSKRASALQFNLGIPCGHGLRHPPQHPVRFHSNKPSISIGGSGDIHAAVAVEELFVSISASGDCDARDLVVYRGRARVAVKTSGAGTVRQY